jgi:hypothetical protein
VVGLDLLRLRDGWLEMVIPKLTAVPITAKDYAMSAICMVMFDGAIERLSVCRMQRTYLEGCEPPEVAGGRHCECCGADELDWWYYRELRFVKERWVERRKESAINTVDGASRCTSLLFACDGTVLLGVGAASAPLSGLDALRQPQRPRCCYTLVILVNLTGGASAGQHCCSRHGIPMVPSRPNKRRSR